MEDCYPPSPPTILKQEPSGFFSGKLTIPREKKTIDTFGERGPANENAEVTPYYP